MKNQDEWGGLSNLEEACNSVDCDFLPKCVGCPLDDDLSNDERRERMWMLRKILEATARYLESGV